MQYRRNSLWLALLILGLLGCGKAPQSASDTDSGAAPKFFGSKEATLPVGTVLTVKLDQAVGSKISANGDSFSASIASPVEADGKVVIPTGSAAKGHVVEAVPEGRFKGGAVLKLVLDSVTVNGKDYDVQTGTIARSIKGKGKRTAAMVGGGAGAGALIGGLAGGGKGALIGAAVGAGAGTAGAAYTGNKNVVLPAEAALGFRLVQPLTVKM
jgi:hypothetical protein